MTKLILLNFCQGVATNCVDRRLVQNAAAHITKSKIKVITKYRKRFQTGPYMEVRDPR